MNPDVLTSGLKVAHANGVKVGHADGMSTGVIVGLGACLAFALFGAAVASKKRQNTEETKLQQSALQAQANAARLERQRQAQAVRGY